MTEKRKKQGSLDIPKENATTNAIETKKERDLYPLKNSVKNS